MIPKTAEGIELDDETREDLARWRRYQEKGEAIPYEYVMAWLDDLATAADARTTGK